MNPSLPKPRPVTDPAARAKLAWLRDRMIEDVIPDYADGLYDADPEGKAIVEDILSGSSEARSFFDHYTAATASLLREARERCLRWARHIAGTIGEALWKHAGYMPTLRHAEDCSVELKGFFSCEMLVSEAEDHPPRGVKVAVTGIQAEGSRVELWLTTDEPLPSGLRLTLHSEDRSFVVMAETPARGLKAESLVFDMTGAPDTLRDFLLKKDFREIVQLQNTTLPFRLLALVA